MEDLREEPDFLYSVTAAHMLKTEVTLNHLGCIYSTFLPRLQVLACLL
jgi:hypothetical protein